MFHLFKKLVVSNPRSSAFDPPPQRSSRLTMVSERRSGLGARRGGLGARWSCSGGLPKPLLLAITERGRRPVTLHKQTGGSFWQVSSMFKLTRNLSSIHSAIARTSKLSHFTKSELSNYWTLLCLVQKLFFVGPRTWSTS